MCVRHRCSASDFSFLLARGTLAEMHLEQCDIPVNPSIADPVRPRCPRPQRPDCSQTTVHFQRVGQFVTFRNDPGRAGTRTKSRRVVRGSKPSPDANGLSVNEQIEAPRIIGKIRHVFKESREINHVRRPCSTNKFTYCETERKEKSL